SGAAAAPSSGSTITYDANDHTLTVHVTAMPLQQVLDAISAQSGIRFQLPAPATALASQRVTRSFERMGIERAIKQLLGPSNTAMIYETETKEHGGERIVLREVKVLEMGAAAVSTPASVPSETAATPPPVSYKSLFTPEQIQANRAAVKEKKAEKKQAKADKRGGGRGSSSKGSGESSAQSEKTPTQPSPDSTDSGKTTKSKSSTGK
ncbi:MAG: hypothetical protein AB1515_03200, partial [Nitrospirota bacterium]